MKDIQELLKKDKAVKQRNRVKRLKRIIVIVVILLLIMPSIFCLIFWLKLNKLEREYDILLSAHKTEYQEYLSGTKEKDGSNVVYAAEKEDKPNSGKEEGIQEQSNEELEKVNENKQIDHSKIKGKKVYLTFDDGPSKKTSQVLDILKENNVKATFFVVGKEDDYSLLIYKRIVNEGHTLGIHTYSHDYKKIYKSIDAFSKDFDKLYGLLYKTTNVKPKFYRFPGGSSNTVSNLEMKEFIQVIKNKNMIYYDWNVINGDATGKKCTANQMVDFVLKDVKLYDNSVVLMHDAIDKDMTIQTLPTIIKRLKKEKVNMLPINETSKIVQHIKAESIQ